VLENNHMDERYQAIRDLIKPRPTAVQGLSYFPDLEPDISNDQDHPPGGWMSALEVSDANLDVVRNVVTEMKDRDALHAILEIGVNRNGERSMSRILLDERPEQCHYLGVDIDDKSYLDDHDHLIYTVQCSSSDQSKVRDRLREMGVGIIDLLFIDGWHSVNQCVNDWRYTDLLSPTGVVILHDTNSHPGCVALFEAVDPALYHKTRYCLEADYGIAVFRKVSHEPS
jgi:hypothetical protein